MSYYYATICLNGHVIDKHVANVQKFCTICGKETFSSCNHCHSPIRGVIKLDGVIGSPRYSKPFYCHDCGSPYPWTQKILDNAIELVSLDDEIDNTAKELIKDAIPELLIESPTTPVAMAKYQKGMSHASQILRNSMRQLLIDVASETVKKFLFP